MKKNIVALFLLLAVNFIYSEILLTTVKSSLVHSNFSGDLNPFSGSKKVFKIEKNCILKLLDELDYSNGFNNDILKVEIISGNYSGQTAYIYEEYTALNQNSKENKYKFFFKKDYFYGNKLIKKNTICEAIKSKIEDEQEVLTIEIDDPNFKDMEIPFYDKNELHFIINKRSEISYNLQQNFNIIKIIDSRTLMPVKNASCDDNYSDKDGYMYLKNKNRYIIDTNYYSDSVIYPDINNHKIIPVFLEKLKIIENPNNNLIEKNDFFSIRSDSKRIGLSILDKDSLQIFSYPSFNNENFNILSGFYFKDLENFDKSIIEISKTNKDINLIYFSISKNRWENINLNSNEKSYYAKLSDNGFYLIIEKIKNIYNEIKIKKTNLITSPFYIKNRQGNLFYKYNFPEDGINILKLPIDEYEVFFLSPDYPDKLISFTFNNTENSNIIIDINNLISKEKNVEKKGFYKLYNGLWIKRALRVNNIETKSNSTFLEHFGNIYIEDDNKIKILNDNFIMDGYINIIDNKRIDILINYISKKCFENYTGQTFIINPSLFNSEIIIPAYYSIKAGILEIDFNCIYFTRKKSYKLIKDKTSIEIDNYILGIPKFPESESSCRYKLIYTQ